MPVNITLQIVTPPQCYYRKMDLYLPLKYILLLGDFLIVSQSHLVLPYKTRSLEDGVLPSHLALSSDTLLSVILLQLMLENKYF